MLCITISPGVDGRLPPGLVLLCHVNGGHRVPRRIQGDRGPLHCCCQRALPRGGMGDRVLCVGCTDPRGTKGLLGQCGTEKEEEVF